MGCMVPQLFSARRNRSYPDLWVITGDSRYSGYKTLIAAPEPSIERAAGVIHSMGCRIGTHMLLWAPSWDSVVRPWGRSLHSRDLKSHGGAHRVAPEAASELKAKAEVMLHMYFIVLY
jgi:hypothetical protein